MAETFRDEITQLRGSIRALNDSSRWRSPSDASSSTTCGTTVHRSFRARHDYQAPAPESRGCELHLGCAPGYDSDAPVIYALIIPVLLLDLFVAVYQTACFPVYGSHACIGATTLAFDREQLAYLNAIEKLNCAYCAYA